MFAGQQMLWEDESILSSCWWAKKFPVFDPRREKSVSSVGKLRRGRLEYRRQSVFCFLRTAHCAPPTAHCPLLTAYCSLPTAHRPLRTAHCAPPTARRPLRTAHCSPLTAHCSLLTAYCFLLTAYCLLLYVILGANAGVAKWQTLRT